MKEKNGYVVPSKNFPKEFSERELHSFVWGKNRIVYRINSLFKN